MGARALARTLALCAALLQILSQVEMVSRHQLHSETANRKLFIRFDLI